MYGCNWSGMFGAGHGFMGGGFFGLFWNILIVALIAVLGMKVIQSFRSKESAYTHDGDPLEILKGKFVRGEISEEEFQRMRNVLLS